MPVSLRGSETFNRSFTNHTILPHSERTFSSDNRSDGMPEILMLPPPMSVLVNFLPAPKPPSRGLSFATAGVSVRPAARPLQRACDAGPVDDLAPTNNLRIDERLQVIGRGTGHGHQTHLDKFLLDLG